MEKTNFNRQEVCELILEILSEDRAADALLDFLNKKNNPFDINDDTCISYDKLQEDINIILK